jgi:nucleoside 2-deoxyribosyltransferase
MNDGPRLLLVGQVLVDVTLPPKPGADYKLRFGGVIHAARACWALGIPYGVCFLAPSYLRRAIEKYLAQFGAQAQHSVGLVDGSPNVILMSDVRECGAQGYQHLLREDLVVSVDPGAIEDAIGTGGWTDVLVFPSGQDAEAIFKSISMAKPVLPCHVDAGWLPRGHSISGIGQPFETLIASTSTPLFLDDCGGDAAKLCDKTLGELARSVILKENRGGARLFQGRDPAIRAPAHIGRIAHSVGVGDVFNVAFIAERRRRGPESALKLASLVAAAYARTTDPDTFAKEARAWNADDPEVIRQMQGVSLPWEARPAPQIYIASPDFDYMDCAHIDALDQALKYHNFSPRRPVREFGQAKTNDPTRRRQELVGADLELLKECRLLVAVMLSNDPGTLIEIGLALERRMPVIVYDPYRQATNLMLRELPLVVSADLDEILGSVFTQVSRVVAEGT